MEMKIQISTPKGCALSTAKRLKQFWGLLRYKNKVYGNPDDDTLIWVVDCTPRQSLHIARNLGMWSTVMKGMLANPLVRKAAKLTGSQRQELDDMLTKQTKIEILKGELDLRGFTDQTAHF